MRLLAFATLVLLGQAPSLGVAAPPNQAAGSSLSLTPATWTKFCFGPAENRTCMVYIGVAVDDGRSRCEGFTGWSARLTEWSHAAKVTLLIGVPRGFATGTIVHVQIDDAEPLQIALDSCTSFGCWGNHITDARLIDRMWNGNSLIMSGPTRGQIRSHIFPLSEFGDAYTGPPLPDPKLIETTIRKFRDPMWFLAEQENKIARCEGLP